MLKLRQGQIEVAAYRGGLLAVPAVPGAGKTTVLAHLATELICEGRTGKGKILIVTVMNSAVANFRSRVGEFLEQRGLRRNKGYEVKTLHSLAMTILKEKPEMLLINNSFQIIDEFRQLEIISSVVDGWLEDNRERCLTHFKLQQDKDYQRYNNCVQKWLQKDLPAFFKQSVAYIKSQGINTAKARELLSTLTPGSYLAWTLEVYLVYAQVLKANGQLDFDDLIVQALSLLQQDPGVLQRLQRRWTYIFEDEAQDSNPLQEKILKLLSGESGNLVRVGDSNQAILGTFTSAEPQIFRDFCRQSNVKREAILVSSRSSRQVIDLANYVVRWCCEDHPEFFCRSALEKQYIYPVAEDDPYPNPVVPGYTIAVKGFTTQEQEMTGVARLAALQARKRPENTLAVLVPTRNQQTEMAALLSEIGADFEEVGRVTEEQARTISHVKTVIDYLARPQRANLLLQVLTQVLLPDIAAETAGNLQCVFQRFSLEDILYPVGGEMPWLELPDELADPAVYAGFVRAIGRLKSWLAASTSLAPENLVLYLAGDLQLAGEQLEIAHNLASLIRRRVAENPHWKLIDIAKDLPRIEDSLRSFTKAIYEQRGFVPRPGVITLLTTHKSKGLEWDTVYLTGVTASEYPSSTSDRFRSDLWYLNEEQCNPMALMKAELSNAVGQSVIDNPVEAAKLAEIGERMRLLYVAITRSRKNLLITYHDKNIFNKKTGPARALQALQVFIGKGGEPNE